MEIVGLTLTTFGALWLVLIEWRTRSEESKRLRKIGVLQNQIRWLGRVLKESLESIAQINVQMGGPAYDPEKETERVKEVIAKVKAELEKLTDPFAEADLELSPVSQQMLAFAAIALGFIFQLIPLLASP